MPKEAVRMHRKADLMTCQSAITRSVKRSGLDIRPATPLLCQSLGTRPQHAQILRTETDTSKFKVSQHRVLV